MTDDRRTKNAAFEGTCEIPCLTPCPHQHPETWKCRWDGLMKPEGKCQPHTFEHRPMKWGRHTSGFYSSIRCMVSNASVSIPGGEPEYAPPSCSVISLRFKGGDITHQLNHATYHKLKASGMLWELYPDAPDVFPSQNANLTGEQKPRREVDHV